MAGVILLAAGCGSGSPSSSGASSSPGTSNVAKAVALANCLRAHDPGADVTVGSNGSINIGGGGGGRPSTPGGPPQAAQSAMNACRHLEPNGGPSQAQRQDNAEQGVKYAQCMRAHGVPDFSGPSSNGTFSLPNSVNMQGSAYQAASRACQSVKPQSLFINQGPSS
jgi:hypothetical protein